MTAYEAKRSLTGRFRTARSRVATQRMALAKVAGQAAAVVAEKFERWRTEPDPESLDQLCLSIREHSMALPIVYFAEWVDRWLMGDEVPGPDALEGKHFQLSVMTPKQAIDWADRLRTQFPEQKWLAYRLREAAEAWSLVVDRSVIVSIREVTGASTSDDDVREFLEHIPGWLTSRLL